MSYLDPWHCVTVKIFSMCSRKYFQIHWKYLQTRNILQQNKISKVWDIHLLPMSHAITFSVTNHPKREQNCSRHELRRPEQVNKKFGSNILLSHILRTYSRKIGEIG